MTDIFQSIEEKQKLCLLLHDEVYVKKVLLYHGGTLFGKGMDALTSLAKSVLGVMVNCLFGGPSFISKMIPINKLNSQFLFEQFGITTQSIKESSGLVKAIICDGNRINQAFFKMFRKSFPDKPWLTNDGIFLIFDYVYLLKNIRKNWLAEKTGQLIFIDKGVHKVAQWDHLKALYELEPKNLVKLSNLNEVSIFPKPIRGNQF